jgi:hypothetical protein
MESPAEKRRVVITVEDSDEGEPTIREEYFPPLDLSCSAALTPAQKLAYNVVTALKIARRRKGQHG